MLICHLTFLPKKNVEFWISWQDSKEISTQTKLRSPIFSLKITKTLTKKSENYNTPEICHKNPNQKSLKYGMFGFGFRFCFEPEFLWRPNPSPVPRFS
jgi:hypothetical protein